MAQRHVETVFQTEPCRPDAAVGDAVALAADQHAGDEEEIHRKADAHGNHHAFEVDPSEIMHLMVEFVTAGEVQRQQR